MEAIVWKMPRMDFIMGLPDILCNFLDRFVKILRDIKRTLNKVDISLVITKSKQVAAVAKAGVNTDMQENKFRSWRNGKKTEAPEEMETLEPSHFDPVLQFMEIPFEEAKAECFEMLDGCEDRY